MFNIRLSKKSASTTEILGNITLKVPFDDSFTVSLFCQNIEYGLEIYCKIKFLNNILNNLYLFACNIFEKH